MTSEKNTTLLELMEKIGGYLYDTGDYNVIANTSKDKEVAKFIDAYLPGAKILKDGLNGNPLAIQGKSEENIGTTGAEAICCHGYQIYDMTGATGQWVIATFADKSALEKHILSTGGFLNIYCTDLLVLENGEIKPYEILFAGDNEESIVLDKEILDENFDVEALQSRISINWK